MLRLPLLQAGCHPSSCSISSATLRHCGAVGKSTTWCRSRCSFSSEPIPLHVGVFLLDLSPAFQRPDALLSPQPYALDTLSDRGVAVARFRAVGVEVIPVEDVEPVAGA